MSHVKDGLLFCINAAASDLLFCAPVHVNVPWVELEHEHIKGAGDLEGRPFSQLGFCG